MGGYSEPELERAPPMPGRKEDSGILRWLPWVIWVAGVAYGVFTGIQPHGGPAGWIPRGLLWAVDAVVIWIGSRRH
jgi:hypothetical protein